MNREHRLSHSTLDLDRACRIGQAEVVYGAGKTAAQVAEALGTIAAASGFAFATRVTAEKSSEVLGLLGAGGAYHAEAAVLSLGTPPAQLGLVGVVSAGTSDQPVAAEVECTAQLLGNGVLSVRDVGVSGLHRILSRADELRACRAVVVVAGMDGALPSVVGGLVACPVIAVPTSVGYGASFGGLAALLAMLNSCAPGVTVVNIDNGFGGAYAATRINRGRPVSAS
jgi:pyridinium-3,5-biscarboxylic acid mononucleotide synthase